MYFWLKLTHIAAMTLWFTGLFLLPRVFVARVQAGATADHDELNALGRTLYFGLMTPAGVITVVLGTLLIGYGPQGFWLYAKLGIVALAVLQHLYIGQLLFDLSRGHARHRAFFYSALNWSPLLLLLGIVALTAAKPGAPSLLNAL
jgi:putative membrane protein